MRSSALLRPVSGLTVAALGRRLNPTNLCDELPGAGRLSRQSSELRNPARMVLRTREMPVYEPPRIRCRRTLGPADPATCLPPLRYSMQGVLALYQNALPTGHTIIGRVERGFADFAKIPYHDACKRQELLRLIEESLSD